MNNHRVRARRLPARRGRRPCPATKEQHQVGGLHELPSFIGSPVRSNHAQTVGMGVREAPLARNGGRNRHVQPRGEVRKLLRRVRDDHAPAADDQRGSRGQNSVDNRLRRSRFRRGRPGGIGDMALVGPDVLGWNLIVLNVVRQSEVGRPWSTGGHGPKGGTNHARDMVGARDDRIPLRERLHKGFLIDLRERKLSIRRHRDVGCNREHARGGFAGLNKAGQYVGGTAPGGALADSNPPGNPRVSIRHVRCSALVANQDMGDVVVEPVHRVVKRQRRVPAQAEHMAHLVSFKHPKHRLGAV